MAALDDAKVALTELRATTLYQNLKKNLAANKITQAAFDGTHIAKSEKSLLAVISELQPAPAPTPTPTPTPTSGWSAVWDKPAVTFTPLRTIQATTTSALASAIASASNRDYINYTGGSIGGEFTVTKQVSGLAVVNFNGARFTGTNASSRLPAMWLNGASGLRFINFDLTNAGGDGILIYDANGGLELRDFKVHDTAGQGIHLAGIKKACDGVTLHGEVTHCGLDLTQDPHAEKGTGLHGFYSGGSAYPVINCNWTLDVHDQPHGAAMQINRTRNTHISLRARNITFVATQQVGGNALQFWATSAESLSTWNDNMTVDYLEADNVARAVETNGMEAGSLANTTVLFARTTNARKSPVYASGPRYVDVK